jgi:hypothetical protein
MCKSHYFHRLVVVVGNIVPVVQVIKLRLSEAQ